MTDRGGNIYNAIDEDGPFDEGLYATAGDVVDYADLYVGIDKVTSTVVTAAGSPYSSVNQQSCAVSISSSNGSGTATNTTDNVDEGNTYAEDFFVEAPEYVAVTPGGLRSLLKSPSNSSRFSNTTLFSKASLPPHSPTGPDIGMLQLGERSTRTSISSIERGNPSTRTGSLLREDHESCDNELLAERKRMIRRRTVVAVIVVVVLAVLGAIVGGILGSASGSEPAEPLVTPVSPGPPAPEPAKPSVPTVTPPLPEPPKEPFPPVAPPLPVPTVAPLPPPGPLAPCLNGGARDEGETKCSSCNRGYDGDYCEWVLTRSDIGCVPNDFCQTTTFFGLPLDGVNTAYYRCNRQPCLSARPASVPGICTVNSRELAKRNICMESADWSIFPDGVLPYFRIVYDGSEFVSDRTDRADSETARICFPKALGSKQIQVQVRSDVVPSTQDNLVFQFLIGDVPGVYLATRNPLIPLDGAWRAIGDETMDTDSYVLMGVVAEGEAVC